MTYRVDIRQCRGCVLDQNPSIPQGANVTAMRSFGDFQVGIFQRYSRVDIATCLAGSRMIFVSRMARDSGDLRPLYRPSFLNRNQ